MLALPPGPREAETRRRRRRRPLPAEPGPCARDMPAAEPSADLLQLLVEATPLPAAGPPLR